VAREVRKKTASEVKETLPNWKLRICNITKNLHFLAKNKIYA